jgi:hypothetical protein
MATRPVPLALPHLAGLLGSPGCALASG